MIRIHPSWREALASEFSAPYFSALTEFVRAEYAAGTCYPPAGEIFAAFDRCPFPEVKVVLLGQDPYHGAGQAEGLCFSVRDGVPLPPSLQNIFKELHDDLGIPVPTSGSLRRWADQRCAFAQCNAYGSGRRCRFAPGTWVGRLHRCGNSCSFLSKRTPCVPPLGGRTPGT